VAALGRTPEPSKRFHSIALPISEVDREWYRSHPTRRGAIYFGRNRAYRFDAPDGEYGVLYVGADPHVAFIESFQIAGTHPVVTEAKLRERSLSRIRIRRPLRLVNLAESGALTRIGADARVFTASYTVPQRWSRAIHSHPDRPDGILYRPRHDPARLAAAFFDHIERR
jgi:RES domain